MFKDSDPPVSLFSFQDIVTTLIGIMILFVLLLSLELMETTRTFERNSPVMEELKQLRERRRSLEARSEEMSRRLETLAGYDRLMVISDRNGLHLAVVSLFLVR